ncbi:acetoacyl-CoA synthetase [Rickenella mellea]|uniref:Acetoacyl-CoA synthetase n=1 Tax=Rickenella mellea TaxID=50990 RepID=A0A4R5XFW7_9AGAM|nr:acetoacyl-CoA synthetase [Rickenella mellea]
MAPSAISVQQDRSQERITAPLWQPSAPYLTSTYRFLRRVNEKYNLSLASYFDLYQWSTTEIGEFWSTVWDETGIIGDKGTHVVDAHATPAANPAWFTDAKVNWAENMLQCRSAEKVALIEATEPFAGDNIPSLRRVTYAKLYELVSDVVSALLKLGLQPGDRVASYSSNCIENIVACLATSAIGCIWVSAAADFGPEGVLERFEQVRPTVIFSVSAVVYNGKVHNHWVKLSAVLSGLAGRDISPNKVVVVNTLKTAVWSDSCTLWDDFISDGAKSTFGRTPDGEIEWRRCDFNWPLWILFSSGTTGKPKPIVHRAGGMLIQARKEFAICADLKPEDVFFYYTTTGWMMWNFLVAGLASACTLVLYDGSPLRDPSLLWRMVDDLGITIFGTSAKYLDSLSQVYKPLEHHKLSTLRHIYSTGSPLAPALFDFVYEHIHPDILLGSITGGTDICSLFAGMCTALPVFRGEIQCRLLGMAIQTYSPTGTLPGVGVAGELVCLRPFPCQPAGFWPLPGFGDEVSVKAALERYRQAYFAEFPDVWYHGDHVILTPSLSENGGGLVMLGRSDGVLNPGGVRFGSSEIYDVLDTCFKPSPTLPSSHVVFDCLAVGQSLRGGTDERVILFIKLGEGVVCTDELQKRIKAEVRARRSPRHVPEKIIQVQDVPYTLNGKRVEVPVKKIINGAPISSVNPATLRNPECLKEYETLGRILRDEVA